MNRYLLLTFFLFNIAINAKDIHPLYKYKAIGFVSDFVVKNNKLYSGSDEGVITIHDVQSKKLLEVITLEPVTTELGELQSARILSLDYINNKLLIVSIGKGLYRNVWIYEKHQLKKIIDESAKLTLKEARFLDDEKILLASFASEIILHDFKENYTLYKRHVTQSTLGDITLSKDKKRVIMCDESGEVRVIDTKSSKTLQVFDSQNVDNLFHVAYANGVTVTAGQDRRVGVYHDNGDAYHLKSDFLVYCVGITPSGKTALYSSGENSSLQLFNTTTKQKLDRLVGHSGVINQIKFINENELFSSDGGEYIFYWKLQKDK
ncbi:WD40 repeat domain-containing protein [Sulfurimonas sp.]